MNNNWVRKAVENWNRVHTDAEGLNTHILLLSDRQEKFLHLKHVCYMGCGYCEKEATDYLESRRGR